MNVTANNPDGGQLFKLATKCRVPHLFGEMKSEPAEPMLGRYQQTERACPICRLVKITVHPPTGEAYRLWRWDDAPTQFADRVTPECRPFVREKQGVQ